MHVPSFILSPPGAMTRLYAVVCSVTTCAFRPNRRSRSASSIGPDIEAALADRQGLFGLGDARSGFGEAAPRLRAPGEEAERTRHSWGRATPATASIVYASVRTQSGPPRTRWPSSGGAPYTEPALCGCMRPGASGFT